MTLLKSDMGAHTQLEGSAKKIDNDYLKIEADEVGQVHVWQYTYRHPLNQDSLDFEGIKEWAITSKVVLWVEQTSVRLTNKEQKKP